MPNIVYLWDFETGDTQGWTLGSRTTLDSSSKLQGTYSLKYYLKGAYTNLDDLVASISGIDLSTVTKPLLLLIIKDESTALEQNNPYRLGIVVKDGSGTILLDITIQIVGFLMNFTRIVVLDLSVVAGLSNLTLELRERGNLYYQYEKRIHYYDMIAIIDGADYEYNTGMIINDNEEKTIEVDVPSTDGDLSGIGADRFGICLTTPDWKHTQLKATAVTDQGSSGIDSGVGDIKHTNYVAPSIAPATFQKLTLYARVSIGAYDGWDEKVAVLFLDSAWNYKRVYLFNIHYTANGVSPRFVSSVNTTTYGSTVSGSKDINVKIHGNKLDVALKVKYLVGDPSIVSTGTVKLTVYSSDKTTNYGSVEINLTVGFEQISTYITGLPTDVDLVFTIEWSITANARVVLLIYPLVKVS